MKFLAARNGGNGRDCSKSENVSILLKLRNECIPSRQCLITGYPLEGDAPSPDRTSPFCRLLVIIKNWLRLN